MPPRGVKKGTKRARQYEHVKESERKRGASRGRRRGDRGTHGQQGACAERRGGDVVGTLARGHLVRPSRRAPQPSQRAPGQDARPALRRGEAAKRPGPLEDDEGGARTRARRWPMRSRDSLGHVLGSFGPHSRRTRGARDRGRVRRDRDLSARGRGDVARFGAPVPAMGRRLRRVRGIGRGLRTPPRRPA